LLTADEVNLAPDAVLQAIEMALDTGILQLTDSSSAQNFDKVIKCHADFRLFATQNPGTGFFKGKREKLSASFLGRFVPVVFKELPKSDWVKIVVEKLLRVAPSGETETSLTAWATHLVNFHVSVQETVVPPHDGRVRPPFPEPAAYAETYVCCNANVVKGVLLGT
jgi:MoxR-like ATPase